MSFFDKIKQQASVAAQAAGNVAQNAVQQTKTLASVGRVKLAIASEEDKMKKAYTELGKLFYRDYEAQTEADMTDYEPWCGKIADAKAQIQRLNEELEKLHAENENSEVEPAPEEPAPEGAIEVDLTTQEAPAEPAGETPAGEADPEPVEPQEPTVGTLYVDVTGTEE